ncbi:ABC-3 protein [Methanoregula boonei 6A8]|jgi:zinc/manganese transport system permease protein|uniref:ABC-3 protein n=1 Tax=Methanoregula boonei (strain DSM 21154 / JCM 14090 / 6A8) TaxID=456442 RepID=A7I7H4_METB6|nr:metal ABC transporter permease [Methanoregula boonei]ABS55685.1 ABC-3 protein [Methanoregula boonei 6A8]
MVDISFSFNLLSDLQVMWQYDFMQHAFEAGTIVAIIAGIVGYFVVLRRSSFAAHALSHIGFAGAAGAVLIGVDPIIGLLLFTSGGGITIGLLGRRAASRDIQIGTVLAFMLGLGVLFISLYSGYATEAYSILFGEILGISGNNVLVTLVASLVILLLTAVVYRPLLFASLDEDVAEAKGLPTLFLGVIFMLLVAVATSISVQVVGVLLIFALMVTPAAIAQRLAKRPLNAIMISVFIALIATWIGLFVSFYEPYPVSFFITTIVFSIYLITLIFQKINASFISKRLSRHENRG